MSQTPESIKMTDKPSEANPPTRYGNPSASTSKQIVQSTPDQPLALQGSAIEIQRLKGSNWATWKWQLQNALDVRNLTGVLTSSESAIPIGHPKEVAARQIISSSLDSTLISKVIHCHSAQEIWKTLRGIYENRTSFALTDLIGKMNSYKMNSLEDIDSGISAIQSMACQIKALGGTVDDVNIESAILRALPSSFSSFITSWTFLDSEKRTLTSLHAHLMQHASLLKSNTEVRDRALVAQLPNAIKKTSRDSKEPRSTKPSTLFCKYCKKPGHVIKDCRKLLKKRATENKQDPNKKDQASQNTGSPKQDTDIKPDDSRPSAKIAYGLMAVEDYSPVYHKVSTESFTTNWMVDSGCSFHMTPNKKWLHDYADLAEPFKVRIGDESLMEVIGQGFIVTNIGIISPVFYLPKSADNLFSTSSAAMDQNIFTLCTDQEVLLFKDNVEICRGELLDRRVYQIKLTIKPTPYEALLAATLENWHQKLAHIAPRTIEYMATHRIVDGLQITESELDQCEACAAGKCHRSKHPSRTTARPSRPGQVLHFDTVGPAPVESISKAVYYVLCKDACSGYRFVFFVKNKGEIADMVKVIISRAKLETRNQVLSIVTDNGSEYINANLREYLLRRGIHHSVSAAYTPQQNGLIEREIQTVGNAARTIRINSRLPKVFWAEAINNVVYTLNRVINSKNKDQTPYEIWHGKKPSLSNIHTFGEAAMVLTPDRYRDKLDPKGECLIFTGYTDRQNTYRFVKPDTYHLVLSCDVTFLGKMYTQIDPPIEEMDADESIYLPTPFIKPFDPLAEEDDNITFECDEELPTEQEIDLTFWMDEDPIGATKASDMEISSPQTPTRESYDKSLGSTPPEGSPQSDSTFIIKRKEIDEDSPTAIAAAREKRLATLRPRNNDLPKYTDWSLMTSSFVDDDPDSFKAAMKRSDKEQWLSAMQEELDALKKCDVWSLVDRPVDKNVVSNRWVLRIKRTPDGKPERYRARLVARGFSQIHGVDYYETYSPTASMSIVRLLFAFAALMQLRISQFDIKTAFLYGDLDEEVYMDQPQGFVSDPSKVWRLNKSLYGLKQAPRQWCKKFTDFLKEQGLKTSLDDRCVFYRLDPFLILLIYVDDGLTFAHDQKHIDDLLSKLGARFEMRTMALSSFLGFQIERDAPDHITLHQTSYVNKIIRKFGMDQFKPERTPISSHSMVNKNSSSRTLDSTYPFKELIGSLLYASSTTRVDIAYAVGIASRASSNPCEHDWRLAIRIVRYLLGQPSTGLSYQASRHNGLVAYCDADYANDEETSKSTSGLLIIFGGAPIHWRSKRQEIVATSSTEAEVISLCSAVKDSLWINNFALELGIVQDPTVQIYCDNQSAIKLATSERSVQRTKHFRTRLAFLQEQVEKKKVAISHVSSNNQLADMLTKPLPISNFTAARNQIMSTSKKSFLKTLLLGTTVMTVLALFMTQENSAYQFDTVKPIIYQTTDKFVDAGEHEYEIDYTYSNPCDILKSYVPKVTNTRDDNDKPKSINPHVDEQYVMTFIDECNRVYQATWMVKIHDLLSRSPQQHHGTRHKKRGVGDMILGGVVSNLISVLYEHLAPWSTHNQLKIAQAELHSVEARINKFNNEFNATIAVQKGIIDLVKNNARSIREQNRQLTYFKELSSKLTWLSSYIQTRILFSAADLRTVNDEILHRRVATRELADLFNMTELIDVSPIDTEFISVTNVSMDTLKFRFNVRKSSPDTNVYKVLAFRYWDNLTHAVTMKDYQGAHNVLYNPSINCVKGIEDTSERVIFDDCNIQNYATPDVNHWRSYTTNNIYEHDLTTFKRTSHHNYIYCFPYSIKIGEVSYRCPTSVFKLPTNTSFVARNVSFTANVKRIKLARSDHFFIESVSPLHFDNTSIATSDALFFDRVQELEAQVNRLLKEQEYSVTITKQGVAWWSTITTVGAVSIIIVVLIVVNIQLSKRLHEQSHKVASDVAEIKNYEPISCVNCRKNTVSILPKLSSLSIIDTSGLRKTLTSGPKTTVSDSIPMQSFGQSTSEEINSSTQVLEGIQQQIYDSRKNRIV